jgi:hypothetical protein
VLCLQPAVVGATKRLKGPQLDHCSLLAAAAALFLRARVIDAGGKQE